MGTVNCEVGAGVEHPQDRGGRGRVKRPSLDLNFKGARLDRLDFSGMDLRGKDFSWASISYCDFRGAQLERSIWRGCDVWNAQFDWRPPGVGDAVIIRDGMDTPGVILRISYYAAEVLTTSGISWWDVNVLVRI